MKKAVTLLAILSLVTATAVAPAHAGKGKRKRVERKIEAPYATPAAGVAVGGDFYGACKHGEGAGCALITPNPGELFAAVAVRDAAGLPVQGFVTDVEANQVIAEFCGATNETVFLGSDEQFLVWVFAGPCTDGTPAMATSGSMTVTLSNRP